MSGTATITPTATLTPTPGSPTVTATSTPTLAPVPGASATAVVNYKTAISQITSGANISEQDYLDLVVAPNALKTKVTDLLAKDVPTYTEAIHAQHILTDTEAGAQKILLMLKQGQDFTQVANAQSSEQITREVQGGTPNGGDLGWFDKDGNELGANSGQSLDKTFTDAAWTLQPGQYSSAPVKNLVRLPYHKGARKEPQVCFYRHGGSDQKGPGIYRLVQQGQGRYAVANHVQQHSPEGYRRANATGNRASDPAR